MSLALIAMVMSTHCPLKELFIIQHGTLGALRYGMHGLLNVRQRPVLIISVMFTDIKGPVFSRTACVCFQTAEGLKVL